MKFKTLLNCLFVSAFSIIVPSASLAGESAEKFVYNEDVYRDDLNRPHNMANFNRAIGIMTDLLREQRRLFGEKRSGTPNDIADKAEEEMNEANLLGAQSNFDEAYALLHSSFGKLSASIKELVAEPAK